MPKVTQAGSNGVKVWKHAVWLHSALNDSGSDLREARRSGTGTLDWVRGVFFSWFLYSQSHSAWCHPKLMVSPRWSLPGCCVECLEQVLLGGSVGVLGIWSPPVYQPDFFSFRNYDIGNISFLNEIFLHSWKRSFCRQYLSPFSSWRSRLWWGHWLPWRGSFLGRGLALGDSKDLWKKSGSPWKFSFMALWIHKRILLTSPKKVKRLSSFPHMKK